MAIRRLRSRGAAARIWRAQAQSFDGLVTLSHGRVPSCASSRALAGNFALGSPAIGTEVVVRTKGGRVFHAQSDGGSGHSGKRSPDVHIGLGPLAKDEVVTLELTWRSRKGEVRRRTIEVKPDAWYTVQLDS